MNFSKLSIIVPVYNEENTILNILNVLTNLELINNISKEIIVVNDFSTDKSDKLITEFISKNLDKEISYYKHNKNKGKGAALHIGIKEATGDYLIVQDADLEYDPNEFNLLIKVAFMAEADVVYG